MQGHYVAQIRFDAAVTLIISGDCELRISTNTIIKAPNNDRVTFPPESVGSVASTLISLFLRNVISAEAGAEGDLGIAFNNGIELTVAPDPTYEAWQLVGPKGRRVICLPGGELALWSEETSDSSSVDIVE
jgi:hypothetical protein